MARRNEILSLNLNETPEPTSLEEQETTIEKLTPREAGAQFRKETAQKFHQSAEHFGEVGHSLWSGLKRISREKWEGAKTGVSHGIEVAKTGVRHGAEAGLDYAFYGAAKAGAGAKSVGRGMEKTAAVVAETPDWLLDKTGEGLYEGVEATKRAGAFAKGKAAEAAGYSAEKVKAGYDWTAGKMSEAGNWTSERYADMKNSAGEQVDAIKARAGAVKDKFVSRVESVKATYRGWQEAREKKRQFARLESVKKFLEQVPNMQREAKELEACLGLDQKLEELQSAA